MRRNRSRFLANSQSRSNLSNTKSSTSLLSTTDTKENNDTTNIKSPSQSTTKAPEAISLTTAETLISSFCTKSKQNPDSVESLPIFLYPKINNNFDFLMHFESLVKLEIVFCKLIDINGISACHHVTHTLQILNLSNNKIQSLDGIQHMLQLQELHVGENEITSLQMISSLHELIVLDFHDNFVDDLSPIAHCKKLTIIRAGNNRIRTVGNYLKEMNALETLNLSANHLLFYDEIDAVSAISSLNHLQLNDPHFGPNPICEMSNYHIYSLYKLKRIQSLDGIKIDDHSKKKAQVSMYKKTMFYQILYNCAKRDEVAFYRMLYRNAMELCRVLLNDVQFAYQYISKEGDNAMQNEMSECINEYNAICNQIWDDMRCIKTKIKNQTRRKYEMLKYELKTAGNVRLIECNHMANNSEYQIIESLIQSKISNASTIHILSAMKIENKFVNYAVQNNINTTMDDTTDGIFVIDEFASTDAFSWVLEWNSDFKAGIQLKSTTSIHFEPSEYQHTIVFVKACFNTHSSEGQQEWRIDERYAVQPMYMVRITQNNPNISDDTWHPYIQDIFNDDTAYISTNMPKSFHFIYNNLCKKWSFNLQCYLQENDRHAPSQSEAIVTVTDDSIHMIGCSDELIEETLAQKVNDLLQYDTLQITFSERLSCQIFLGFKNVKRIDLSFNSLHCIPDIFVEMVLLTRVNLEGNEIVLLNELTHLRLCSQLEDLNLCFNPIIYDKGFVHLCMNITPSIQILNNQSITTYNDYASPTNDDQFMDLFAKHCCCTQNAAKSVFDEIIPTPLNVQMDKEKILYLNLSHCKLLFIPPIIGELMNMETLNLSHNFILQIKHLEHNTHLKELIINDNNLTSLCGLSCLSAETRLTLTKLEVSCNNISRLPCSLSKHCVNLKFLSFDCNYICEIGMTLSRMTTLVQINASYNAIDSSNDIYSLSTLHAMAILDLKGNAVCNKLINYRYFAIFCVSSLRMLDGESITSAEIEASTAMYSGRVHHDFLVKRIGHCNFDEVDVLDLSHSNLSIIDRINASQFSNLQELVACSNSIADISALLQLKTLTHLNLNHNLIEHVDGLSQLVNLEELQLSHNRIENMASLDLAGMTCLKFLYLENNKLTHINGLSNLPALHTLHLNDNKIRKLSRHCLNKTPHLEELNLENNGLRSLEYLDSAGAGALNLKILNISNNRINHPREFKVLRHLPHLVQIYIQHNPITATVSKTETCMYEILKCTLSLQFIDNTDVSRRHCAGSVDDTDTSYDSCSSSLVDQALQNPIGLKIQQFVLSTSHKTKKKRREEHTS
eukprot:173210_1